MKSGRPPSPSSPITPTREYWYERPVVYHCYDASGRLIYIGCSIDVAGRFYRHSKDAWWFGLIAKVRISVFPTHLAALAAEKQAIKTEDPAFNVMHTDRWFRQSWTADDHAAHREWLQRLHAS